MGLSVLIGVTLITIRSPRLAPSEVRTSSERSPGVDPYPSVVDTLGALTGGELVNGTEEDFVPIE